MLAALVVSSLAVAAPLDDGPVDPDSPHVEVTLVLDTVAVAQGSTAWLGVSFDIDEHWHLYWPGLNDSGLPISLDPTLPEGFTLGEWRWPAPVRHVSPGDILDHVYEGRVTLCAPLSVDEGVALGAHEIRIAHDWLVCREACMFGSGEATLEVDVVAKGSEPAVNGETAEWFAASVARWPAGKPRIAGPGGVAVGFSEADVRHDPEAFFDGALAQAMRDDRYLVQVDGATRLAFYPYEDCSPPQKLLQLGVVDGDRLELTFDTSEPSVRGVLEINRPDEGPVFHEIEMRADR